MIHGSTHDQSLDIWALGVLLYEMLIGKAPFASPDHIQDARLAKRIIESNIVNLKVSFPDHLSYAALDLIRRLLNPDPSRRPSIQ
jgi:serine/threonine protein kinase